MSHHVIEFKDLHYTYPGGREALKGITFSIYHGESVGLVGANGAGKSTLLMQLTGLLLPTKGQACIGEIPIEKGTLALIRQKLGFVFQNPEDQLFMGTVYDDVAFGPRNYKLSEEIVEQKVTQALSVVGIAHLKDRPPYKLSGGEKHLASIATALSMEPDILIMDEPTAALDPKARRRIINLLNQFTHTKIIATHDLDMVLETCTRTIIIKDGLVAYDGPTVELLTDEVLMDECGLELPLCLQNTVYKNIPHQLN